ncbi:MAG: phosphatidylserine decarboxylase, partial [Stellaceae bacterium]
MLRHALAPIHPDVWRFIAIATAATVVLYIFVRPLGWVGLVITLWVVYFFRDPWRVTPQRAGLVIAPADGLVVSVGRAPPPPELGMGNDAMLRIGIFLNILDVHVNRMPIGGRVLRRV